MERASKTNAMRILEARGVSFTCLFHDLGPQHSGLEVAQALGEEPERVFKTLVTQGKSGQHHVFMLPVVCELDLKKAAAAAGEKSVAMVRARELVGLTGYVHGGCSPIGMKKPFPTCIDETAALFEHILCSGGRIGCQIELRLKDLIAITEAHLADITV